MDIHRRDVEAHVCNLPEQSDVKYNYWAGIILCLSVLPSNLFRRVHSQAQYCSEISVNVHLDFRPIILYIPSLPSYALSTVAYSSIDVLSSVAICLPLDTSSSRTMIVFSTNVSRAGKR